MGSRIKDVAGSQTQFNPDLVLLVDKVDTGSGDWLTARKLKLGITGNTRFQGSVNNINWHDNIEAEDEYFKFSTDGGTIWKDLSTINVKEDTNLYFTEARVLATTGVQDAIDDSHTHTNKTLLDSIIDNGDGNSFLSDDGSYLNIFGPLTEGTLPVKGVLGFEDSPVFVDGTSVKIGDASNNLEIEADGTIKFNGTSTTWDDLGPEAVSVGVGGSAPTFSVYNGSNLRAYEFVGTATTKEINMMFQIPHGYKEGSDIIPHIHLYIPDDVTGGTIKFSCNYTWTNIDSTGSVAETTVSGTVVRTAGQGIANNAILSFGTITGTGKNISSIFSCRIFRNPTDGDDTFASSVWLKAADIHVEKDTFGSHGDHTK